MRLVPYVVVLGMVGCNVNGPDRDPPRVAPPPAADPEPLARAAPAAPPPRLDRTLGAGLEMRRPIRDGRLTLIPIVDTRLATAAPAPGIRYLTLADGMAQRLVIVTEVSADDWDVDWVRVTNKSALPLAILGGELIIDGKQDRVIADDVVLAAHSSRHVPARCVEEKREIGGTRFHDGQAVAELSLRRTLAHRDQDAIWAHVNVINARNGLRPYTRTYRGSAKLLAQGDAARRRTRLLEQLGALEERNQVVGLAVAIDGEVVAFERFATPELYRALEGRLLASYLPTTAGARTLERDVEPAAIRAFASRRGKTTAASFVVLRR